MINDTAAGGGTDCKHSFVCNITRGQRDEVFQRECVPFSKRCNGIKDCTNGRDEKNCVMAESTLGTSRFIESGSHAS